MIGESKVKSKNGNDADIYTLTSSNQRRHSGGHHGDQNDANTE